MHGGILHRMKTKRRILEDLEDFYFLDEQFDRAILGYIEVAGGENRVVYDKMKCLLILMEQGQTNQEAIEYLDYTLVTGSKTPVFFIPISEFSL